MPAEDSTTGIEPKLWVAAPTIGVNSPAPLALKGRTLKPMPKAVFKLEAAI